MLNRDNKKKVKELDAILEKLYAKLMLKKEEHLRAPENEKIYEELGVQGKEYGRVEKELDAILWPG